MQTFKDIVTGQVWQFDDDVADIHAFPSTPATLQPYTIHAPTAAQLLDTSKAATKAQYESAIQAYLDAAAHAKGYDSILSACSYAGAVNPFQAEGVSFVAWRGAVWQQMYAMLAAVQGGAALPTIANLIISLPPAP